MLKARDGLNTEAIVIWRQKLKNYSRITLMTQRQGLIICAIPHRRLVNLKGAGYLQPFNAIQATLKPASEGTFSLEQVDGMYAIQGMADDFDKITYAAIAGELIMSALGKYQVDQHTYRLVSLFSQTIRHKSIRLATIILGWQLLMLGGFIPSGRALRNQEQGSQEFWQDMTYELGRPIGRSLREALASLLSYSWKDQASLNLTKQDWQALEHILYSYSSLKFERELKAVSFLQLGV